MEPVRMVFIINHLTDQQPLLVFLNLITPREKQKIRIAPAEFWLSQISAITTVNTAKLWARE